MFVVISMRMQNIYICAILCHLPSLFMDEPTGNELLLLILDPSGFSHPTEAMIEQLKGFILDTSKYPGASRSMNALAVGDIEVRYPQVRLSAPNSLS